MLLRAAVGDDLPLALHYVMFVPNIRSLCDEEQLREWLPQCRDFRMVGCYAQTELGHGSNVRALETTATFGRDESDDKDEGHFIVHSPTLTSTKFWPGTLGRTANHAMIIARLVDGQGVDRGVHNFLVPLRCPRTHLPLPGVDVGDVGPKIGYNNMDNGFCRFTRVKIPRRHMAMRFVTVDRHGQYKRLKVSDAASKVSYITMMQVRAFIVNEASKNLAMACTVVVRYSAVRRQGYNEDGTTEKQVLDYTQQQHRVLPLLAASYCFFFTGRKLLKYLVDVEYKLVHSKDVGAITKTQVADLHASSSCLKSFCTTVTADGIEECRKACGGHGFLQCSGLPELLGTYLQNPTVEGDNHMLPQQTVRVLLKLVQCVEQEDEEALKEYKPCDSWYLVAPMKLLMSMSSSGKTPQCAATTPRDFWSLELLVEAFRHRAARLLLETAESLQTKMTSGSDFSTAWNDSLVQMARVSRAHALALLVQNFHLGLLEEEEAASSSLRLLDTSEVAVLKDCAILFATYWMEKELGDFLEDGYLNQNQARWLRRVVLDLLHKIRPNAVALVDANDVSDFRLKSALGRFDGDVYPAIMEAARNDPLNDTPEGPGWVHLKKLYVDGVGLRVDHNNNDNGVSGTVARL